MFVATFWFMYIDFAKRQPFIIDKHEVAAMHGNASCFSLNLAGHLFAVLVLTAQSRPFIITWKM